jgi:hypothetical protein|tara:strand:- start:361 stop:585 length:225 start_codon:yes stop_codon:yes gene_type:complete
MPTTNKPFFTAHTMQMPEGDWQLLISVRGLVSEEMALVAFETIMPTSDDSQLSEEQADEDSLLFNPYTSSRYVH